MTATLPVTLSRVLHQRRVTNETVLGALCAYVLLGLLFAFAYLAVNQLDGPFFSQPPPHSEVGVPLLQLRHADDARFRRPLAAVGLPQGLTVLEALTGQIFLVTMVARLVTVWGRQSLGQDA